MSIADYNNMERVHWIDIARGICIIAIVVGHVFTDGFIRWCVYSFHVPAFFFLSGLCYKSGKSLFQYIEKRVRTIVVPYFFFSVISIFALFFAGIFISEIKDYIGDSILSSLFEMIYGNSKPEKMRYNLPLWFLSCFFSTSMLVYFEETIKDKTTKFVRLIFVIICILIGCYFSCNETIALIWHIETAFSMAVWFVLGIQCKQLFNTKIFNRKLFCWVIGIVCSIGGVSLSFLNNRIVGVRNEHYGIIPIYYLSAMITIIGIVFCCKTAGSCRFLEYIGKNSLGVLVIHKFPILFFQKIFRFSRNALVEPNSLIGEITGIFVSVFSICISLIIVAILKSTIPWCLGIRSKINNEN